MVKLEHPSCISMLYHEVINEYTESGFQNKDNVPYMHTVEEFSANLEIAKGMDQFKKTLVTDIDFNKKENYLLYTFDDGGRSALKSSQILEKLNCKGHYFITTYYIDQPLFLNKNEIRDLADRGHCVGAHSHTHPMIFRTLSYKKMLEEWRVSKEILQDVLGAEVNVCSVPGGDADQKTYESAIESGFQYIFNSEPDSNIYSKSGAYILGRFSIKNSTTQKEVEEILLYKNHKKLQSNRKIKNMIKKIIFPIHSIMQNKKNIDE